METTLANIVNKANNGDPVAYGELYSRFFTPIYRYVYARTFDKDIADDVAQDTFVKIFEKMKFSKVYPEGLFALLITVARNTLYDNFRKKRPDLFSFEEKPEIIDDNVSLENETQNSQDKNILMESLQRLSGGYREIIILHIFEEKSYQEISEILCVKEELLRKRLSRAILLLKDIMKKYV